MGGSVQGNYDKQGVLLVYVTKLLTLAKRVSHRVFAVMSCYYTINTKTTFIPTQTKKWQQTA